MKFTPEFLDELRRRVPLSSIIGTAVSWDRRKTQRGKGDFWACCPFHGEKTPSFHVEDRKGRYYCFGCHASGDHFRFLTDHNGLSFPDAVARVADMAGVAMPTRDAPQDPAIRRRVEARKALDVAAKLYGQLLADSQGNSARRYAEGRGLSRETLDEFSFGLSPSTAGMLTRRAEAQGVSTAALIDAGLALKRDDGSLYERFRGRLMIPIHDRQGRVIGFGGRDLVGREPKYLNSPQTALFDKSAILFNHHRAQGPAHRTKRLFVVEGYLDAIALANCGIGEVVASLGTALTEAQIKLAWSMADEPVLCFDGDKAGRAAASRAMDRIVPLLSSGKSVQILTLPDGADPDDIVRAEGREGFERLASSATSLIDALVGREAAQDISTPERIAAMEQRLSALAGSIQDEGLSRIYRDFFRQRTFELRREATSVARRQRPAGDRAGQGVARGAARGPRKGAGWSERGLKLTAPPMRAPAARDVATADLERTVVGLLIMQPGLMETFAEALRADAFVDPVPRRALAAITEAYSAHFPDDAQSLLVTLPGEADRWLPLVWGQRDEAIGSALLARFSVLGFAPPPAFLQRCVSVFVERLNVQADARELLDAPALFAASGAQDDGPLLAMSQAIDARRAALADAERTLADEAATVRRAHLANRAGAAA